MPGGLILAASPAQPANADEAAALAAANHLLGRLTGKDPSEMNALTLPEGGTTPTSEGPDGKPALCHFGPVRIDGRWRNITWTRRKEGCRR